MYLQLFHATAIAVNSYTIWYDQMYMVLPFPAEGYGELPIKGRLSFATFWCLYLQTIYFIISLLNDIFGTNEVSPRKTPAIRSIKDLVFSLAFPVGLFISIMFWSVYSYDKELVFPDYVADIVPVWGNMVLHVTNSVFISIEILFSRITYPSRPVGLTCAVLFNISYLFYLVRLRLRTGAWIYPLFDILDVPKTAIFFVMTLVLGLSLYFLGEKLSSIVNYRSVNKNKVNIKKRN